MTNQPTPMNTTQTNQNKKKSTHNLFIRIKNENGKAYPTYKGNITERQAGLILQLLCKPTIERV